MKKFITLLLVLSFFFNICYAQETSEDIVANNEIDESSYENSITVNNSSDSFTWLHENDGKKHYFTGIGIVAFWNIGLCSYNKYILGSAWAQVGPDIWDHCWEREMKWDRDWYWTNFVLHPYQGSIYYMGARGANLNKLESFGLTVLGSTTWEFMCERNAPSINDMVYTTFGAFSVGEMLYRLSLEADSISSLLGFAVNPTRLWTQLWTRQKPLGTTGNINELSLKLSLGNTVGHTNLIGYKGDYDSTEIYPIHFSPELHVVYGDAYKHDSNDPYSQFDFLFKGAIGKGSGNGADCNYADLDKKIFYNIKILSDGMLFARSIDMGENKDTSIGMVMEYDFDWQSYYLLSSLAPGFAIKQRINYSNNSKFEWQFHLAGIILGTSDFYYYRRNFDSTYTDEENGKENGFAPYNYNMGAQTVIKAKYQTQNGSSVGLNFRGYAMYDMYNQLQWLKNGEHGTQEGIDLVSVTNLNAELALNKKIKIGIEDEIYSKYGNYKHIKNVSQIVNTASVYAKIQAK